METTTYRSSPPRIPTDAKKQNNTQALLKALEIATPATLALLDALEVR